MKCKDISWQLKCKYIYWNEKIWVVDKYKRNTNEKIRVVDKYKRNTIIQQKKYEEKNVCVFKCVHTLLARFKYCLLCSFFKLCEHCEQTDQFRPYFVGSSRSPRLGWIQLKWPFSTGSVFNFHISFCISHKQAINMTWHASINSEPKQYRQNCLAWFQFRINAGILWHVYKAKMMNHDRCRKGSQITK